MDMAWGQSRRCSVQRAEVALGVNLHPRTPEASRRLCPMTKSWAQGHVV